MKKPTERQQAVMALIGTFGYLSTKDIAKLAWPQNDLHSAHVMAQDVATGMVKRGYLSAVDMRMQPGMREAKQPKAGVPRGYVLTTKGAELLNEGCADKFIETDAPPGKLMLWFAAGDKLSTADYATRTPLIDLLHKVLAADPSLHPVGARGTARNFCGLHKYAHFDAVLVDDASQFVMGVHLAHHLAVRATETVAKLCRGDGDPDKQPPPFIIAADTQKRLATMLKWRADKGPNLDAAVWNRLPPGIEA